MDQVEVGLQIGAAYGIYLVGSSALSLGSCVLGVGSSTLLGSAALSRPAAYHWAYRAGQPNPRPSSPAPAEQGLVPFRHARPETRRV